MTKSTFKTIIFVIIYFLGSLMGLAILGTFILMRMNPLDRTAANHFYATMCNFMPLEILILGWILFFKFCHPFHHVQKFRKNANNRGELVNRLSKEGIFQTTSAGSSVSYPWSVCDCWRESKEVFILILQSRIYFTYPKAYLSAAMQDELRSILAAHLPMK